MAKKIDQSNLKFQEFIRTINKKMGYDAITIGSSELEFLPTGISSLDTMLCGGIPKARTTIIWGPKSAGKSSLTYHIIKHNMKNQDKMIMVIDAEHILDPQYLQTVYEIDVNKLLIVRPERFEDIAVIASEAAKQQVVSLVVIDSIVAVSTEKELKQIERKGFEGDTMAALPQAITKFFKATTDIFYRAGISLIVINQIREDMEMFSGQKYRMPGGNHLKHQSALTLFVKRMSKTDMRKYKLDLENEFGVYVKVEFAKTGAKEGSEVAIKYVYGKGFSDI